MFCTAEPELNMLQDTANSLISPNPEFKPGDIVGWKPHLKNKKQPCSNSLNCSILFISARYSFAVVQEVLSSPVFDPHKSAGTPYFHEPLDVKLGVLDSDGVLFLLLLLFIFC